MSNLKIRGKLRTFLCNHVLSISDLNKSIKIHDTSLTNPIKALIHSGMHSKDNLLIYSELLRICVPKAYRIDLDVFAAYLSGYIDTLFHVRKDKFRSRCIDKIVIRDNALYVIKNYTRTHLNEGIVGIISIDLDRSDLYTQEESIKISELYGLMINTDFSKPVKLSIPLNVKSSKIISIINSIIET